MAFAAFPADEMRPTALLLNVVAASYATWRLHRASAIDHKLLLKVRRPPRAGRCHQSSCCARRYARRQLNRYRTLAACYAQMRRFDEARVIVARLRAITPLVMPSDLPWRNPEDRELYVSGLRLAAGEAA